MSRGCKIYREGEQHAGCWFPWLFIIFDLESRFMERKRDIYVGITKIILYPFIGAGKLLGSCLACFSGEWTQNLSRLLLYQTLWQDSLILIK